MTVGGLHWKLPSMSRSADRVIESRNVVNTCDVVEHHRKDKREKQTKKKKIHRDQKRVGGDHTDESHTDNRLCNTSSKRVDAISAGDGALLRRYKGADLLPPPPPHWLCAQKSINAIRRRRRWKRGKGHGRTTSAGRVNESNKPTSHDDLWEPTIFFFLSCVCGDTSNFTLPPPGSFVCSTAQKSSGNTSVSSFQINNFRLAAPEINNNERRVPLLLLGSSCLFFRPPLQIKKQKLQYQL